MSSYKRKGSDQDGNNNNNSDEKKMKRKSNGWSRQKTQGKNSSSAVYWDVEKIIGKRINFERNRLEYCVKWLNYPESANSWEGMHNLRCCIDCVNEFEMDCKKMFRDSFHKTSAGTPAATKKQTTPVSTTAAETSNSKRSKHSSKKSYPGNDKKNDCNISSAEEEPANDAAFSDSSSEEETLQPKSPGVSTKQEVISHIDELGLSLELTPGTVAAIKALYKTLRIPIPRSFVRVVAAACTFLICSEGQREDPRSLEDIMNVIEVDPVALHRHIVKIRKLQKK